MKKTFCFVLFALLTAGLNAGSFTAGDLAVLQVGDGSAALNNSSTALFINEFTTSGSVIQTINLPTSGGSVITLSGSATSEGELTLSSGQSVLTFAGYAVAPGTASVASTTASAVNRAVGVLDASGNFSRVATGSTVAFSGNNVRGAVSDGTNFWMSGTGSASANQGIWYSAAGAPPVQITNGNLRCVNIFNANLYVSSAAGTPGVGIHAFSGLPTAAAASTLLFAITGGSPSPVDFALSPNLTLAYVADDRSGASGGGIQRWTFNGSTWALDYTLKLGSTASDGIRQIAVDFGGDHPVIYGTSAEASTNRLVSVTDTGASSSFSVLATAGTNTVFRGVDFAPVPEPSAWAILTLGLAGLGVARRGLKRQG